MGISHNHDRNLGALLKFSHGFAFLIEQEVRYADRRLNDDASSVLFH